VSAKIKSRRAIRKGKRKCERAQRRRLARELARRKERVERRIDKTNLGDCSRPMITASNIHYEVSNKMQGLACGGIGSMHQLALELELPQTIDRNLALLKLHLPYHESDHVLNLAYNALAGGRCLEDLELRRQDESYLNALGARRIPDPTTAGDFCRRFTKEHIRTLQDLINDTRRKVWARQPASFFKRATIDMDGVLVETTGECKQGMDISYKGIWGYHPLVVSLAETGEVLNLLNRSGNRPSHEGAADEADRAMALCLAAGFQQVLLRGDTDFSQTKHLDRWDADSRVRFIFGMDVMANLHVLADDLDRAAWQRLVRQPRYEVKTTPRKRPENVKERIVREREFENQRLESEDVAEFDYRPTACEKSYRMVVIRKNLAVERGEQRLFDDYLYFFYITNDRQSTAAEIVFSANDRCNQENLNAQLKSAVRALTAPLDTLESNWAWMVTTALAWNLKAWWALWLPETPGRWHDQHVEQKLRVLRMEFRTFVNAFMMIPCQIVHTGRRLVYRLLAWNPWQTVFFRLQSVLRC
jgi:Transposase DDE domain group 1